ncbi:zinc transporter subunit: membrane component of ABC superfamily [Candidatus Terasakiella magnetica]|nr:zinc transporter subunit: membrane component of ABC superfamily [Candidatus Terasakiella magnetica]
MFTDRDAAMDEFLLRALLAGLGLAVVAGPLGCFVAWRRMAYFGDALSHTALLGIVAGLLLGAAPLIGVAAVCIAAALILAGLQRDKALASDSILGIISHGSLALGLVLLSFLEQVRVDLMGWLFGDILAVTYQDAALIWAGAAVVLTLLALHWRTLLAMVVDEDLARVEGYPVERGRVVLMLLVALTVAAAMKVVGVMLVTAMLVIPAAAARRVSRTPEQMALAAAAAGALAVVSGLGLSWRYDTPSGPSIVVMAVALFIVSRTQRG